MNNSNKNFKDYINDLKTNHNNCVRIIYHGNGVTEGFSQNYVKELIVNANSIIMDSVEYVQSEIYANMKIEIVGKIETVIFNDETTLDATETNINEINANRLQLMTPIKNCKIKATQLNCDNITDCDVVAYNIDSGDIKVSKLLVKNNISADNIISETITATNVDCNDVTGDFNIVTEEEYTDVHIDCHNITGDLSVAKGRIDCSDIVGNITMEDGEIDSGDITGDVTAKTVNCADLTGDVTASSVSHNDPDGTMSEDFMSDLGMDRIPGSGVQSDNF